MPKRRSPWSGQGRMEQALALLPEIEEEEEDLSRELEALMTEIAAFHGAGGPHRAVPRKGGPPSRWR